MERLIRQAFVNVDTMIEHIDEGKYDLCNGNGEVILPAYWESIIQPGWTVTMHMWPMPESFPSDFTSPPTSSMPQLHYIIDLANPSRSASNPLNSDSDGERTQKFLPTFPSMLYSKRPPLREHIKEQPIFLPPRHNPHTPHKARKRVSVERAHTNSTPDNPFSTAYQIVSAEAPQKLQKNQSLKYFLDDRCMSHVLNSNLVYTDVAVALGSWADEMEDAPIGRTNSPYHALKEGRDRKHFSSGGGVSPNLSRTRSDAIRRPQASHGPIVHAHDPSSPACSARFPVYKRTQSSESFTSESPSPEEEEKQRPIHNNRALILPPKINRSKDRERRPNLRHAKTTPVYNERRQENTALLEGHRMESTHTASCEPDSAPCDASIEGHKRVGSQQRDEGRVSLSNTTNQNPKIEWADMIQVRGHRKAPSETSCAGSSTRNSESRKESLHPNVRHIPHISGSSPKSRGSERSTQKAPALDENDYPHIDRRASAIRPLNERDTSGTAQEQHGPWSTLVATKKLKRMKRKNVKSLSLSEEVHDEYPRLGSISSFRYLSAGSRAKGSDDSFVVHDPVIASHSNTVDESAAPLSGTLAAVTGEILISSERDGLTLRRSRQMSPSSSQELVRPSKAPSSFLPYEEGDEHSRNSEDEEVNELLRDWTTILR
jgi:hypothetical protein